MKSAERVLVELERLTNLLAEVTDALPVDPLLVTEEQQSEAGMLLAQVFSLMWVLDMEEEIVQLKVVMNTSATVSLLIKRLKSEDIIP